MRRRPRPSVSSASEEEARRVAARERLDLGVPAGKGDSALRDARLHRDDRAAELTDALGAQAVTVGPNVYLSPGAPDLHTAAGKQLLVHELTHVVQQDRFGSRAQLFTAGARWKIADDHPALMALVQAIVNASSTGGSVNMNEFVLRTGGETAGAAMPGPLRSEDPTGMDMLTPRYLFTRRCGLIDMRHFCQLMYVAWFTNFGDAGQAARGATRRGVEHERKSGASSQFTPEDLTSNALGAWTATQLAGFPQREDLVARIRETLERCAPVDFSRLSLASQNTIVSFYAAQTGAGEPLNQNTTAVALIASVPELADTDRSFPFELDSDDSSRTTLAGPAFHGGATGLTGDSEIRSFVSTQREEVLRAISATERVRLCSRLVRGWVSDDDIDAFVRLFRLADTATRAAIRVVVPATVVSGGHRTRLRLLYEEAP